MGIARVRQRARARRADVTFARELEIDPPEEWRRDIDQTLFPGGYFRAFIFFHHASKTLILTDTIMNLELDMIDEPWRTVTRLTRTDCPRGQTFFGMRLPILLQWRKAQAVINKIRSWQPRRVILSHGRCFDAHATRSSAEYSESRLGEAVVGRPMPAMGSDRAIQHSPGEWLLLARYPDILQGAAK